MRLSYEDNRFNSCRSERNAETEKSISSSLR